MSRIVTFGEIMLRIAPSGYERFGQSFPGSGSICFAGAEANAAVGIAQLGGRAAFVSALPRHAIADACIADLKSYGVETDQVVRTDSGRLGVFYFESGVNQRPGQVVYDRGNSSVALEPPESYDWDAIFEGAAWFLISGITPAVSRNAFDVSEIAMQEALRRNVRVALDVNYRSKLWRWDPNLSPEQLAGKTLRHLAGYCDLLVCGRADAKKLMGLSDGLSDAKLPTQLCVEYPNLSWVATSVRKVSDGILSYAGRLYAKDDDSHFLAPSSRNAYRIDSVVDRLGVGDAFIAGMLLIMSESDPPDHQEAVEFATASGCLAHTISGDYALLKRSEVEALLQNESQAGRVDR